jgi:hypothetical protein
MRGGVSIAAAGNVLVPALLALRAKGYRVTRIVDQAGPAETWRGEKTGEAFIAEDTLALLGLVALYEARGERWLAEDADIDAFFAEFP